MTASDREVSGGDDTIEIVGDLSPRRAEALVLEIRQLAQRCGVEVRCRVVRATDVGRVSAQ